MNKQEAADQVVALAKGRVIKTIRCIEKKMKKAAKKGMSGITISMFQIFLHRITWRPLRFIYGYGDVYRTAIRNYFTELGFDVDLTGDPPYRIMWAPSNDEIVVCHEDFKLSHLVQTGRAPVVIEGKS